MSTNASVGAPDHHGASGGSGRFFLDAVENNLSGNSLANEAGVRPRSLESNASAPGKVNWRPTEARSPANNAEG